MSRSGQALRQWGMVWSILMTGVVAIAAAAEYRLAGPHKPIYGYSATLEMLPTPQWAEGTSEYGFGYNVVIDGNATRWIPSEIVIYAVDGHCVERFPVWVRISAEGLIAGWVKQSSYALTFWNVSGHQLLELLGTYRGGQAGIGLYYSAGGMGVRKPNGITLLGVKHGRRAFQIDVSHLVIEIAARKPGPGQPALTPGTWTRMLQLQ